MEANASNGASDIGYQRPVVLLEARAKELMVVARRKPKRKRVGAVLNEARRMKMRSVTIFRPEADVI